MSFSRPSHLSIEKVSNQKKDGTDTIDTLSVSAALKRRQQEREQKMKEIEKAFQNVVDETQEGEQRIFQSVFAENGAIHDEDVIREVENAIVDAEPKTKLGKLGKTLNPWKKGNELEMEMEKEMEAQSTAAPGSFGAFLTATDFQDYKKYNNEMNSRSNIGSGTSATVRDTIIYRLRQHGRRCLIIAILLCTIIGTSTMLLIVSGTSPHMNMTEEMYDNFQVIREELINQGVKKSPLSDPASSQYFALMQLTKEATAGKLFISTILDDVEPVVAINSQGDPSNFNDAYRERRIVAERYVLLTFHHSTSASINKWSTKDNWLSNDKSICDGWHGITCRELLGDSVAVKVVTSINLASNGLIGTIPPDVSHLFQLEVLSLEGNLLEGKVPNSLGTLERLKSLRMSNNLLSGEVPRSVCNLKKSKHLTELISDCGGGDGDIECSCCTECL